VTRPGVDASRRAPRKLAARADASSVRGELVARAAGAASAAALESFVSRGSPAALLVHGDARDLLPRVPARSIDVVLTSPPYWGQRRYDSDSGLGGERSPDDYARALVGILEETKRVLTARGSLWLNLGDTYDKKRLCGVPWRVALALGDRGFRLRNAVVWDKQKGAPCNAKDKLRNVHEMLFHFVLGDDAYYDVDAIRVPPGRASIVGGRVVTPTGVSGRKYERQIRTSPSLTEAERVAAGRALREALAKVETGELPDFRMVIRGCQRATHSDAPEFSGRATELRKRGFYVLPYHRNGQKPGDVWRITPEDEWRRDAHYAVFPLALCERPIRATCPPGGIVLDPFAGTGSALVAAVREGRRAIGIDTAATYLDTAAARLERERDDR
jgi:DNA modification methylase